MDNSCSKNLSKSYKEDDLSTYYKEILEMPLKTPVYLEFKLKPFVAQTESDIDSLNQSIESNSSRDWNWRTLKNQPVPSLRGEKSENESENNINQNNGLKMSEWRHRQSKNKTPTKIKGRPPKKKDAQPEKAKDPNNDLAKPDGKYHGISKKSKTKKISRLLRKIDEKTSQEQFPEINPRPENILSEADKIESMLVFQIELDDKSIELVNRLSFIKRIKNDAEKGIDSNNKYRVFCVKNGQRDDKSLIYIVQNGFISAYRVNKDKHPFQAMESTHWKSIKYQGPKKIQQMGKW